jgi:CHAT domain-containing protein
MWRARAAADDPHAFAVRLSGAASIGVPVSSADRLDYAAALMQVAQRFDGEDRARGAAVAYFLAGQFDRSAASYASIPEDRRDAATWNDLAAAEASAALATEAGGRWLIALDAVDHALSLDHDLSLGLTPIAKEEWKSFLKTDRSSAWSDAAYSHDVALPLSDSAAWKTETKNLDRLSPDALSRLSERLPQQARTSAEGVDLSSWADSVADHKPEDAKRALDRARFIGNLLRQKSGETLLSEAAAAIDSSPANVDLVTGHCAYRDGRIRLRDHDLVAADHLFEIAAGSFERAQSPMANLARFFRAAILFDQSRVDDSRAALSLLLDSEKKHVGHRALIARILYELSLCDAVRGRWSDSLAAAKASFDAYRVFGERGNVADAEGVLSEDYDFLGQPELARSLGVAGLRDACAAGAAGDIRRARTILAALCRTELRSQRWSVARSLIELETRLAFYAPDHQLDAGMYLRSAATEARAGSRVDVTKALDHARDAARRIPDAAVRARVLADIDGVDGTIRRLDEPARAVPILSSAIAFQEKAARPIVLPELHLARGRAYVALNDLDAAFRDFDAGIREIESERTHTRDAELRPGLFDNAADLFQEIVSLQIRRGADPEELLALVERGRARTVLEQIEGDDAPRFSSVSDVQRHLAPRALLIEYVSLPDRLAIFVVDANHIVMRSVAVSRAALTAMTGDFRLALLDDDAGAARDAAGRLFQRLIAPIANDLAGASAMTIVADDLLQHIPFAALFDASSQSYLVERFPISMAPSAGVFVSMVERAHAPSGPPAKVLVFANPLVPADRFPTLPSLDAAEADAAWIAPLYRSPTLFVGDAATAEKFLELAPSYDLIHFAGHGVINAIDPAYSALICADSPAVSGVLTSRQIARMRFRSTRLVILAACSTMAGRNEAVEGVSSLATSFLVAGVPAVLGTLWDVEDRAASSFMRSVHRSLARGLSPSDAVRAAQIEAIRSGDDKAMNPSHWAAFALIGDIRN